MPTRILLRLFLLAGLAAPFCAFALGVGSLQVRSALNQNFNADIPLIVNNPAELIGLAVRIPRQQEFDQVGVERLELMSNLRFAVQTSPGGPNFIKVTSVQPIREPNFDLLLEVVWPRGRLLRTFPVQLDPELYTHRQEPPPPLRPIEAPLVEAPPVASAPAASGLPPAPPVSFEGASFYGPVRPGENLTRIANQVRPAGTISVPDMMAILVAGNPEAFINGNPNLLRVGAVLKVPTPNALGVQGAPVPEPAMQQAAAAPAPVDSTLSPPVPPALPESPASQPPKIATPPESFTPPVSQPPEIATPPVPESPGITPPAPHEETLKPVAPSIQETSPTLAESAPSAPLTPIAPQEIIPQTVMPQAEAPPVPDDVKPSPPPVVQEAAKPIVEESPPAPVPAPKASPPPQETGMEWLSNPVVWIAITLIILAVASVLLVPLLRRPARPKKAAAEPEGEFAPESSGEEASEVAAGTQAQIRKPRPQKQPSSILAKENALVAPASSIESAPKPGVVPPPKPIDELLKDIDFGLGDEKSRAISPDRKQDAMPARARDLEGRRLPDTEPPTASVTRTPDLPPASSMSPDEPGAQTPVPQPPAAKPAAPIQSSVPKPIAEQPPLEPLSELPSGLKLDSLDFDLGDLGLSTTREQPAELPPLELKPVEPPRTADRQPLFDLPEIEPPTYPGPAREPSNLKTSDLKFEFTDVNQEYEKLDANENLAKLDEELLNFGDADLGKMELSPLSTTAETGTDYVETKLDLASAYLDMGDQMGARGLLEDVLREGDASQKKRAEDMLKKVG